MFWAALVVSEPIENETVTYSKVSAMSVFSMKSSTFGVGWGGWAKLTLLNLKSNFFLTSPWEILIPGRGDQTWSPTIFSMRSSNSWGKGGGVLFIKVLKSEIWPTMWDVWWACGGKVQICDHFVLTQPVLYITEFPLLRLKSSFRHWIYLNRNSLLALLMPCKGCYAKTKLTSQLFLVRFSRNVVYMLSAGHFILDTEVISLMPGSSDVHIC